VNNDMHNFLYPRARYQGSFSPEHLVFNANLQEFAQRVGYISNLQTAGKVSPEESYQPVEGATLYKIIQFCQRSPICPYNSASSAER
jgi:hypothetical protein